MPYIHRYEMTAIIGAYCMVCMYICMYDVYMYVCMVSKEEGAIWQGGADLGPCNVGLPTKEE